MQRCWCRAALAAVLTVLLWTTGVAAQGTPTAPAGPAPEGPPAGEASQARFDSRLRDVLLGAADVPPGLWRDASASGPFNVPGISGYLVTFVHGDDGPATDRAALLDLPAGTIVLLKASIQVLGPDTLTPDVLDTAIGGTESATSGGGAVIQSTTDYGTLPLGEASRARSLYYDLQGARVASTAIVFQRGDVIAALNVVVTGDDPGFQQTQQLAQLIDTRLAFLTGAPPTPTPEPSPTPAQPR